MAGGTGATSASVARTNLGLKIGTDIVEYTAILNAWSNSHSINQIASFTAGTDSTSSITGALIVTGGVGISKAAYVGTDLNVGSDLTVTGNATLAGGATIGALPAAGSQGLIVYGDTTFSSQTTGMGIEYSGPGAGYGLLLKPAVSGTATPIGFMNNSGTVVGSIINDVDSTSYGTTSDARLKQDQKAFDGLAIVMALNLYDFAWKNSGVRAHGMFAQEALKVYPEAIHKRDDGYFEIDYSKFSSPLIRAVQQLADEVAALKAEIRSLRDAP